MLLKINAYREDKKNIDINKETDRAVNIKINNQLNQFSNIFIKKLKKDLLLMRCNPILVVPGEVDSIFFEIYFKSLKKIKIKILLYLLHL